MPYDEKLAARIRALLSDVKDVSERKMMGGVCFMVQDRMCCTASGKGGMLVRVGPDAHRLASSEPHAAPMQMGARTMKDFVRVSAEGYRTDAALKRWIKRGLDFVAAMPSKSTSRKKASAKVAPKRTKPR
ncbi:TfoX/Sxy family protein [Bradyrhizobium erythrophlei]|uniref:TfoX/Sxy family protein n=1 Tax=Bradyrhizobium erythrophlei TaxID=1437360 RepID=UPI0035EE0EE3